MNFDGLPGPTHNYSGLARGNLAAERNAQQVANPREAALLATVTPGNYTAVVRGAAGGEGIALVEVYDLDP